MKHFPAKRPTVSLAGVEVFSSRSPRSTVTCTRTAAVVIGAVLFTAGCLAGFTLYGAALLSLHIR